MRNVFMTIVLGFILNMAVFVSMVHTMAAQMQAPGMLPVKVVLILCVVEVIAFLTIYIVRYMKAGKAIKPLGCSVVANMKKDYKQILVLVCAGVIFLCAATAYLRFVPVEAVTMMADINRIDLFGVMNDNPITMMAYYIKSLSGISQANAVCVVVPLICYLPVVCALWEVATALYAEDAQKRNLCFLAEAILVLFGNCMYSMTGIIGSGLLSMTNILLAVSLPVVFALCLRIYHATKKDVIHLSAVGAAILVCLYILNVTAFVLTAMTAFIFALLMIGRRYLPWLKSSN